MCGFLIKTEFYLRYALGKKYHVNVDRNEWESAKELGFDSYPSVLDVPDVPPSIQVAGLEPEVAQARQLIQSGIGGYAPYSALGTLGYAGAQSDLANALARQQAGLPYLGTAGTELAGAQTGLAGAAAPLTTAQAGITGVASPTAMAAAPYITGAYTPISAAQTGLTGTAAPYITGAQAPITTAQTLAEQSYSPQGLLVLNSVAAEQLSHSRIKEVMQGPEAGQVGRSGEDKEKEGRPS